MQNKVFGMLEQKKLSHVGFHIFFESDLLIRARSPPRHWPPPYHFYKVFWFSFDFFLLCIILSTRPLLFEHKLDVDGVIDFIHKSLLNRHITPNEPALLLTLLAFSPNAFCAHISVDLLSEQGETTSRKYEKETSSWTETKKIAHHPSILCCQHTHTHTTFNSIDRHAIGQWLVIQIPFRILLRTQRRFGSIDATAFRIKKKNETNKKRNLQLNPTAFKRKRVQKQIQLIRLEHGISLGHCFFQKWISIFSIAFDHVEVNIGYHNGNSSSNCHQKCDYVARQCTNRDGILWFDNLRFFVQLLQQLVLIWASGHVLDISYCVLIEFICLFLCSFLTDLWNHEISFTASIGSFSPPMLPEFSFSMNSILFQRGIYDADSFTTVTKYGLKMQVTQDAALNTYLKQVLAQISGFFLLLFSACWSLFDSLAYEGRCEKTGSCDHWRRKARSIGKG